MIYCPGLLVTQLTRYFWTRRKRSVRLWPVVWVLRWPGVGQSHPGRSDYNCCNIINNTIHMDTSHTSMIFSVCWHEYCHQYWPGWVLWSNINFHTKYTVKVYFCWTDFYNFESITKTNIKCALTFLNCHDSFLGIGQWWMSLSGSSSYRNLAPAADCGLYRWEDTEQSSSSV